MSIATIEDRFIVLLFARKQSFEAPVRSLEVQTLSYVLYPKLDTFHHSSLLVLFHYEKLELDSQNS